jgi:hypothetical protein
VKKTTPVNQTRALRAALAATVLFANESIAGVPGTIGADMGDHNPKGVIVAANESRFVEANFSEPLTQYALGWRPQDNLADLLQFIAPAVQVPRRFQFAKATNAEAFLSESDDIRAIGSGFKQVEYTSAKANEQTHNKGLTIRVDLDNVDGMPNWREIYTGRLMERCLRNELRRGLTLLAAAGTNTPVTWDTTAGKNPDNDMRARIEAFADAVGIYPNRGLFGIGAWNKRIATYEAQTNATGMAQRGAWDPSRVAADLQLDEIRLSKERYVAVGSSTTKAKLTSDIVLIFQALAGATPEDPSNIKRFISNTLSGGQFRVFEQVINAKLVDITVEHYSNIVMTSTLGVQKLTVS